MKERSCRPGGIGRIDSHVAIVSPHCFMCSVSLISMADVCRLHFVFGTVFHGVLPINFSGANLPGEWALRLSRFPPQRTRKVPLSLDISDVAASATMLAEALRSSRGCLSSKSAPQRLPTMQLECLCDTGAFNAFCSTKSRRTFSNRALGTRRSS
jgi:hypothetical protein